MDLHAPGEADESAREVAAWSARDLEGARQVLLRRAPRDLPAILKKAAVLHTDVAILVEAAQLDAGQSAHSAAAITVNVLDGRFQGFVSASGHWAFARELLASLPPDRVWDESVRRWYRAVAAHLVAQRQLGELRQHLERSGRLAKTDGMLAMMQGVRHQALASPPVQSSLASVLMPPGGRLNVGSRRGELAEARRAYREALRLDPALVEARIRLGRVLADEGNAAEAARELQGALAAVHDPQLEYFAALFLGEAELARGRRDEARACFERSAALFPHAQSPLLALSHLDRSRGLREGALASLDRLVRLPSPREDPWWEFTFAAGRHADTWLDSVRRELSPGTQP